MRCVISAHNISEYSLNPPNGHATFTSTSNTLQVCPNVWTFSRCAFLFPLSQLLTLHLHFPYPTPFPILSFAHPTHPTHPANPYPPACPSVCSPFSRFGIMPIGGRSTAIKLSNGDVWVMASTPLDEPTKETLASMGTVKYIIGADSVHHLYLGTFCSSSIHIDRMSIGVRR